jgi:diadenosine tetraphosphate (Ap4A) HIT family hydrolase
MIKNTAPKQGCPFCRSNNILKGPISATSSGAYMITSQSNLDNYLIIPETHVESVEDLPDTWWQDVKALIKQVPHLTPDYNLSFNIGSIAGQTVRHLHLWVIPRLDGQPASNNGLASLIEKVNQTR